MLSLSLTPFSEITTWQSVGAIKIINRGERTMRNSLNLGSLPDWLVGLQTTLRVDKVRRENGVDERRLAQAGLA